MSHETGSNAPSTRVIGLFQLRLSRLILLVATIAVILWACRVTLWAWRYCDEYSNPERAWTSSQLFDLNDNDAKRRRNAAENLRTVETEDLARTVSALSMALSDPDWAVRAAAARSLAHAIAVCGGITNRFLAERIAFATKALIPACRDPREEVRIEAVQAMGTLFDEPPNQFALPGPGSAVATKTAGSEATQAAAALRDAMKDGSPQVRAKSLVSFARLACVFHEAAGPVKAIAEHDPDVAVRIAAVSALTSGWSGDPLLHPFLFGRLKAVTDQKEHAAIAWAIGELARPPVATLPSLRDALSLAPTSSDAQSLFEPLTKLLKVPHARVSQSEIVNLLARMGPSTAVIETLRVALKCQSGDARKRACVVLGEFGAAATPAIPELRELAAHDPRDLVKEYAALALKQINAAAQMNSAPSPKPAPTGEPQANPG
jgi:HEAT repeat protein